MTNIQLYLAIGIPIVFNTALMLTVLGAYKISFDAKFDILNVKIDMLEKQINQRFDDMRDMWRSELRRVEEVFDARLKHLEERWEENKK